MFVFFDNTDVKLRAPVDAFFDKVLVNAPDPAVRQNRLTLLHSMLAEFSTIADFSEIVTASTTSSIGPGASAGDTSTTTTGSKEKTK